ncbi:peptidylprolyl isomerase [Inhella gelatinilytica]|uniref:peptidylprolyl isomerase n=1 Tax=Inhella gelatinilytica TaxID=2795030 RepID=A0A931IZ52_9BURK|nr:peptidylprolyl isomerase [Inhella gelatinilytica]MBH9552653.1 peptidylprolyl isomerase [Inhella gelatinilytica]
MGLLRREALKHAALSAGACTVLGRVALAAPQSTTPPAKTASHAAFRPAPREMWVRVETELGAFVVALYPDWAPLTVANFLAYVEAKALDGASVYRIVTRKNQPAGPPQIEVVQWGINAPPGRRPLRPPVAHESTQQTGLRHLDGTLSMARLAVGSASSEFFICVGDQPELDYGGRRQPDGQGFAAFGRVVQGMEVVRALHARGGAEQFLPQPLLVRRVRRVNDPQPSNS